MISMFGETYKDGRPLFKCRRIRCTHLVSHPDDTLCKNCEKKDKAKKRKIKRNQKAIGIKQTRKKKAVKWKESIQEVIQNEPIPVIFAKREGKATFIKHLSGEKWRPITKKKFSALEDRRSIMWVGQ